MRVLGVDWGTKRIGLAVGETEFRVATARPCVAASGSLKKDAQAIFDLARKEEAEAVVVGLPLDEGEGNAAIALIGMKLAGRLSELGMKVYTVDEALSSVEAEDRLKGLGLKAARRMRHRDGEAATVILERFFDGQGATA